MTLFAKKFPGVIMTGGRLRNKLIFMITLVGLLPLLAVGFLSVYTTDLSHRLDISTIEREVLVLKANEIQTFLDEITASFELILNLPIKQLASLEDGHVRYTVNKETLDAILSDLRADNAHIEEVSFIDKTGIEIARKTSFSGGDQGEFNDVSRLEYFLSARDGERYVSDVFYTLKGPMVILASPVLNSEHDVVGIIAGTVNLKGIEKLVSQTHFGNEGYIFVVDQEGRVVATSRGGVSEMANVSALGPIRDVLAGTRSGDAADQKRYQSFWGDDVIGDGKKLRSLNLALIAEWPVRDADAFLLAMRRQIIIFSLLTVLFIVVLGALLAQRIVRPVESLEAAAAKIAQGDFNQEIQISAHDEIEDLGASFNEMTRGLKEYQALKDEFVFMATHELGTPVTAIKGYLSMMKDGSAGEIPDNLKNFIEPILRSGERLGELINDLLEVARSEAGRIELETAEFDPTQAISEVVEELRAIAIEKNISVTYDFAGAKKVKADRARVKEVMTNLLGNAIKYTLGSGAVSIRHEVKDGLLATHVRDQGIGISPEAQKKLFEKFYRVKTDATVKITGTGLGLYIVKKIVEKMGGTIGVTSTEGEGSTFSFSLPLA